MPRPMLGRARCVWKGPPSTRLCGNWTSSPRNSKRLEGFAKPRAAGRAAGLLVLHKRMDAWARAGAGVLSVGRVREAAIALGREWRPLFHRSSIDDERAVVCACTA